MTYIVKFYIYMLRKKTAGEFSFSVGNGKCALSGSVLSLRRSESAFLRPFHVGVSLMEWLLAR